MDFSEDHALLATRKRVRATEDDPWRWEKDLLAELEETFGPRVEDVDFEPEPMYEPSAHDPLGMATLQEIGDQIGMSRERVRQLIARSIQHLRKTAATERQQSDLEEEWEVTERRLNSRLLLEGKLEEMMRINAPLDAFFTKESKTNLRKWWRLLRSLPLPKEEHAKKATPKNTVAPKPRPAVQKPPEKRPYDPRALSSMSVREARRRVLTYRFPTIDILNNYSKSLEGRLVVVLATRRSHEVTEAIGTTLLLRGSNASMTVYDVADPAINPMDEWQLIESADF